MFCALYLYMHEYGKPFEYEEAIFDARIQFPSTIKGLMLIIIVVGQKLSHYVKNKYT